MCLVTRQRKPKILKKDLKVYKVLKSGNDSPYNNYHWRKGQLETTKFSLKTGNGKNFCFADFQSLKKYNDLSQCTEIGKGFHACMTKERAESVTPKIFTNENYEICEFLIPKGSEVYYDCTGLIVANQMMML